MGMRSGDDLLEELQRLRRESPELLRLPVILEDEGDIEYSGAWSGEVVEAEFPGVGNRALMLRVDR
jgi:hypothetical protein